MSPPLVIVTWQDAWFDFDKPVDEWREDYLVKTVGFLVRDGDVLSLASEQLPGDEGYRAVTHIPIGVVQSTTVLERTITVREI